MNLACSNNLNFDTRENQMEFSYFKKRIIVCLFFFNFFLALSFPYLLFSQQWTEPEIIAINRNVLNLVMTLDSKESIHLIWVENTDDHPSPDSLYFWLNNNNTWLQLGTYGVDSLKIMYLNDLAIAADQNDNVHLVWGMKRLTQNPLGFMNFIFYRRFSNNIWEDPEVLHDFGLTSGGNQLGIQAFSDNEVVTYWTQVGGFPAIYFKQLHNFEWKSVANAIPQFSQKYNGTSHDPSVTTGPGDSLHITFIGSKDGNGLLSANFNNFLHYACKSINDSEWCFIKEIYRNQSVISSEPKIIVTNDGCRHIFWYIDQNADLWLDNIYYTFSTDGKSWSTPLNLTKYDPVSYRFPHSIKVVEDKSGNLHLIWHYAQFSFPFVHNHYYYLNGREHNWSNPVPVFSENVAIVKGIFDLAIDKDDRLHFVWVEGMTEGEDVLTQVKYATAKLATLIRIKEQVKQTKLKKSNSLKCYPNPFNANIIIEYQLSENSDVFLAIYDLAGREIKRLVNSYLTEGSYEIKFNNSNHPSGIYFVKMQIKQEILISKLILIK